MIAVYDEIPQPPITIQYLLMVLYDLYINALEIFVVENF